MPNPEPLNTIDINILPEAYRRKTAKPLALILGAVAGVLFAVAIASFVFLQINRRQTQELQTGIEQSKATLEAIRTPAPEILALTEQLASDTTAVEVFRGLQPTLEAGIYDWDAVFGAILEYDAAAIELVEASQDGNELRVAGTARSQDDVLTYAGTLDRSGIFEQVIVQSMEGIDEPLTPGITPTSPLTGTAAAQTPLPPTATPEPTVSPYDPYEIDDFSPHRIFPGEAQRHNFSPLYDVDQVEFLGKAGRRYCVQALPQAAGVDTVLQVTLGGVTFENDDCHPNEVSLMICRCPTETITGSLASLIEVQVPDGADQTVNVRVSNRGQFGPDQWYTLLVNEVGGDAYESDDYLAKDIALGEQQRRTFYPEGDVDRVTFPVKGGHAYELRSSALGVGVDTVITVYLAGSNYQSDDAAAGDLASQVRFQAIADGQASAVITNKGLYGTSMGYVLELHEVGGDPYEPDDYVPQTLSPYEHQERTFFPEGDIDRVEFNVKAGRIYEVKTYSLTIGVDTVIVLLVDGQRYENDDITPGDPSSRLVFQAVSDGVAGLAVTNREQYGAYNSYSLTLNELAGTPTPDTTLTPAGPVSTATPDCRDAFEPDDAVGRQILVGESQDHNFCPLGDVDRAVFTAKAGYAYRVETTDLALGVDTYLRVQIGSSVYTNDDAVPQDLSSMLEVTNGTVDDLPVFVTVTNRGPSGDDKQYQLAVTNLAGGESGDAFEPDDTEPALIAFGVAQEHNFAPEDDIDKVIFDTEPKHLYVIYTHDLASGVDTMLSAEVTVVDGSTSRTQFKANDDATAGDPSSKIQFWYEGDDPGHVVVTVSQQGNYGIDKTYQLQVDDLGAGDEHEPDDVDGVPIAIGDTGQSRTFYPVGDLDRVWFTAKAGHRYSIETKDLTGLVDTMLVVDMGAQHLSNDDRYVGTLESFVELHNTGSSDSRATVSIANKGPYSMDGSYTIVVKDQSAEAGDEYEPDEISIHFIAPGEVQRHSFHPDGDVDRVFMQVKAGRRYVLYTCGDETLIGGEITRTDVLMCDVLPPGTDTVVGVSGPVTHCTPAACESDDAFAGTGYLNSRLFFDALVDGVVSVSIHNNGQYGPTMLYYLAAEEVSYVGAPTPALTPSPLYSPTPTATWTPAPPPSPTATATTGAYVPPPSPTATPAPYSMPLEHSDGRMALVSVREPGATSSRLTVPLINKPLLKPARQQTQTGRVRFVLMLKLRRETP